MIVTESPLASERFGPEPAVRFKDESGTWVSKSFAEVGEIVRQLSLGLMELGIEKGDKVSILANTRPEWTYFDFAALTARGRRAARVRLPADVGRGLDALSAAVERVLAGAVPGRSVA